MSAWWRFTAAGLLAAGMTFALGSNPGVAQSRAHVYLLRGLMNIFSLGMDTLAEELERRGVHATVDNYASWQTLADQAASKYGAGSEAPIILIGHSLGADAVMEMAAYLGRRGIPVALVVPFDCTASFSASPNVARVLNLTKHYYMSPGPGFHGSLVNLDLTSSGNIDHLNIDKSPRLHARVIGEVLAIVGAHRAPTATDPGGDRTGSTSEAAVKSAPTPTASGETVKPSQAPPAATKTDDGATSATATVPPAVDGGTPMIARPESGSAHAHPVQ